MFCPACGTRVDDGAMFCSNCGTHLGDKTVVSASSISSDASFEALKAHTKTYVPEVSVKKVEVNPVISASRFSLSSIPMFVITFVFTVITFVLLFLGENFDRVLTDVLYTVSDAELADRLVVYMSDVSIIIWLVLASQALVMCAGLWFTVICGLTAKGAGMNTAGLKMINAITIISFVEFILGGFVVLVCELDAGSKISGATVLFTLALYIMMIVCFAKLTGNISNAARGIAERRFCGDISVYVIFMSFFVSTIILFFSLFATSNRSLEAASYWLIYLSAICIFFVGVALIRYKTVMDNALKESASMGLLMH